MRRLLRIISPILFLAFMWCSFTNRTFALASFSTDYVVSYDISESGVTHVTFNIAQKNNLSTVYATSFSISLSQPNLKNIVVKDASGPLNPQISQTENITNINFDFVAKVVGKDKINNFSISYDSTDIATRQGSVWELNIPRLEPNENTNSQQIILNVPQKFGQPAYIDPKPSRIDGNSYIFNSATLGNKSISAVFGTTQFFKLALTYNLNNSLNKSLTTQIAIPPDTAYQTTYIQAINPQPKSLAVDPDGNWLASFVIQPNSNLQVTANLFIKLNFNPKTMPLSSSDLYTRATKFWNWEDPDVNLKATNLTTPKSVYDYVTNTLVYSYARLGSQASGVNRPGAAWALANPKSAICTEFTDLFIALARKNNIPTRELQGYAISSNDKLKPLSLAKDVLHAWPEYYDRNKQTWVQVDPTWGNTTGGIDYFNKLDLNHIVFAIHGIDPTQPLPAGAYKTVGGGSKDIFVEVVDPVPFPKPSFEVSYSLIDGKHLFLNLHNNTGISGTALVKIDEDNFVVGGESIYQLAPLSTSTVEVGIKDTTHFYPQTAPLIIDINGQKTTLSITYQPNIPKSILWGTAISVAIGFATISWGVHLRRRKRKPPVHW